MSNPAAKHRLAAPHVAAAVLCAVAVVVLLQFHGSAARGYINTPSLFWWWISQWIDPNAETEHGWLILGLSGWLFVRALRCGALEKEAGGSEQEETPTSNLQTPTSELQPPTSELQTPNSELQTPSSKLQTPNSKLQTRNLTAALAAMLAGLALHGVGFAAQQGRVSIIALLIFTWGVLRLAGGRRWGAAAVFPLGFMVFAIPFNALDSIGFWLRVWVVDAGTWLAHAAGINVLQSGTQLVAPDGAYNYDVAAACSGIRSLTALAALSLLVGYINFRSWRRRALVLLLCFPLVYLGNVARIMAIIFAAQLGGQAWGERAHEIMGFGVFAIVLGGVLAAVAAMRRWWPEDAGRDERPARPAAAEMASANTDGRAARPYHAAGRAAPPYLCMSIVVVTAVAEMAFLHHLANSPPRGKVGVALAADGQNPVDLPAFLGIEWTGRPTPVTAVERDVLPADTGFSRKLYFNHRDPSKAVLLSIVLSGRDRTSIHRPELCLIGQGWTITERDKHRFATPAWCGASFPATLLRVRREVQTPRGKAVVPQLVAYWFVSGDAVVATHWQRLLRDSWNRVVHARADRWAYVLVQTDAQDGEAAALARMQAVLSETLPDFQQVFAAQESNAQATALLSFSRTGTASVRDSSLPPISAE